MRGLSVARQTGLRRPITPLRLPFARGIDFGGCTGPQPLAGKGFGVEFREPIRAVCPRGGFNECGCRGTVRGSRGGGAFSLTRKKDVFSGRGPVIKDNRLLPGGAANPGRATASPVPG